MQLSLRSTFKSYSVLSGQCETIYKTYFELILTQCQKTDPLQRERKSNI
jgi:hypothetical protein